jgi:hypothetical protein
MQPFLNDHNLIFNNASPKLPPQAFIVRKVLRPNNDHMCINKPQMISFHHIALVNINITWYIRHQASHNVLYKLSQEKTRLPPNYTEKLSGFAFLPTLCLLSHE